VQTWTALKHCEWGQTVIPQWGVGHVQVNGLSVDSAPMWLRLSWLNSSGTGPHWLDGSKALVPKNSTKKSTFWSHCITWCGEYRLANKIMKLCKLPILKSQRHISSPCMTDTTVCWSVGQLYHYWHTIETPFRHLHTFSLTIKHTFTAVVEQPKWLVHYYWLIIKYIIHVYRLISV